MNPSANIRYIRPIAHIFTHTRGFVLQPYHRRAIMNQAHPIHTRVTRTHQSSSSHIVFTPTPPLAPRTANRDIPFLCSMSPCRCPLSR
jgi:hypothetical protein